MRTSIYVCFNGISIPICVLYTGIATGYPIAAKINEGGYHQNLEYTYTAASPQPMLQSYQSSKYANLASHVLRQQSITHPHSHSLVRSTKMARMRGRTVGRTKKCIMNSASRLGFQKWQYQRGGGRRRRYSIVTRTLLRTYLGTLRAKKWAKRTFGFHPPVKEFG